MRFIVAVMIHSSGIPVTKQLVEKYVIQIGTGQTVLSFARMLRKNIIHATTKQGIRFAILNGLVKIAQSIAKIMKIISVMWSVDLKRVDMADLERTVRKDPGKIFLNT